MSSKDLKRIGAALAAVWAGGNGPTKAQVQTSLLIAGYEPEAPAANKQQLVLSAVASSEEELTRSIIDELMALLRENGYLERLDDGGHPEPKIRKIFTTIAEAGYEFGPDGVIYWDKNKGAQGPDAATPHGAPLQTSASVPRVPQDSQASTVLVEDHSPSIKLLISTFRRLGRNASRPLTQHRRRGRAVLPIDDEYDVQDLVEFVVRCLYSDVRPEEPTPSVAGSWSRMDLLLRKDKIAIELKVTGPGRTSKSLKEQVLIDISDYRRHPRVRTLIVLMVDLSNLLANPAGWEADLEEESGPNLSVRCVVVPWMHPGPQG